MVDALASGASDRMVVGVQLPPRALNINKGLVILLTPYLYFIFILLVFSHLEEYMVDVLREFVLILLASVQPFVVHLMFLFLR